MPAKKQSKRRKWTEEMNIYLLDCKCNAIATTLLENPPLNTNGKKKGYIKIMKELWGAKGYRHLGLTSQNLRDQAARLEKLQNSQSISSNTQIEATPTALLDEEQLENPTYSRKLFKFEELTLSETQYANLNSIPSNQDLHIANSSQIPGELQQTEQMEDNKGIFGRLPEYKHVYKPSMINWGKRSDESDIVIPTTVITDAFDEIATWRENVFLVPYGRIGRDFIDQITLHINDWNSSSENQHIALKAALVLLAVGLQKPGPKSKSKDHVLSKRLVLWKNGEINKLLREGKTIQGRIGKRKSSDLTDKSKIFAKLVQDGQINSALWFLNETTSGDASGAGSVGEIKQWWDILNSLGPDLGYFPNAKKCWIIVKPGKESLVKETFKETVINVTTEGQCHLGAVIGSQNNLEDYVNEKVDVWVKEVAQLAKFAQTQPQACYAAYSFGLKHRWTYFLRTLPDIQDLLKPLEDAISNKLIPTITDRTCSPMDRDILALPVRLGGMGLANPCQDAQREYDSSITVTALLVDRIVQQIHQLSDIWDRKNTSRNQKRTLRTY